METNCFAEIVKEADDFTDSVIEAVVEASCIVRNRASERSDVVLYMAFDGYRLFKDAGCDRTVDGLIVKEMGRRNARRLASCLGRRAKKIDKILSKSDGGSKSAGKALFLQKYGVSRKKAATVNGMCAYLKESLLAMLDSGKRE